MKQGFYCICPAIREPQILEIGAIENRSTLPSVGKENEENHR